MIFAEKILYDFLQFRDQIFRYFHEYAFYCDETKVIDSNTYITILWVVIYENLEGSMILIEIERSSSNFNLFRNTPKFFHHTNIIS